MSTTGKPNSRLRDARGAWNSPQLVTTDLRWQDRLGVCTAIASGRHWWATRFLWSSGSNLGRWAPGRPFPDRAPSQKESERGPGVDGAAPDVRHCIFLRADYR